MENTSRIVCSLGKKRGVFMGKTMACGLNGDKGTIIALWMFCVGGHLNRPLTTIQVPTLFIFILFFLIRGLLSA